MIVNIDGFPNVEMGHEFHLVDNALKKNYKLGYMNDYFTIAVAHEGNRISTSNKRQKQLDNLLDFKLINNVELKNTDKRRILFRHYLEKTSNHLNQEKKNKGYLSSINAYINHSPTYVYDILKLITIKINNKGVNSNENK